MPPKKKVMTALKAEADRLDAVEVLFERVAQGEACDEAHDPRCQADRLARRCGGGGCPGL